MTSFTAQMMESAHVVNTSDWRDRGRGYSCGCVYCGRHIQVMAGVA